MAEDAEQQYTNSTSPHLTSRKEKSLRLYKRGSVWWVSGTQRGVQIRKTTGTTNRKVAEKVLASMELSRHQAIASKAFPVFKQEYLSYRSKVVKPATLSVDRYALDSLEAYLITMGMGQVDVGRLSQDDLDDYIQWLIQNHSKTTARIYTKHLKIALNTAVRWQYADTSPFTGYRNANLKVRQTHEPYLTVLQVQQLLNAAVEPMAYAFLAVLIYTGARRGEALAVTWQDVDFINNTILLHGFKDYADRTMVMVPALTEALKRLPVSDGPLFTMSQWDATRLVKEYGVRAGIKMAVTPKILRRTFGSHLAVSGVDLRRLQELMGHSDIKTTISHYAHLSKEYQVDLAKFLPY